MVLERPHDPEKPLKNFRTRVDGGVMGVTVGVWKNIMPRTHDPYAVYSLEVSWRHNNKDTWKKKSTWNLRELETLYHILRMDAIPFGYEIIQGKV